MPTDVQRIQAVFLAAAEIADPANRAKFLDGACAGDTELRSRVEALLRAHDQADSLLDHPAVAPPDPDHGGTQGLTGTPDPGVAAGQATGDNGASDDEPLACLSPATRHDSLGRLGHYEVLEVLGKGGFGIVFRAFDEMLQRVVAIKVMSAQMAAASPARKRFLREARAAAKVRHEHVVQIYAVEEQPIPHLVMEYIPGRTLQKKLDDEGPLETPEMLRLAVQIARGLAEAHAQGLIHRDIKPANILLEKGVEPHAKLTDFGLARAADDASLTQSGTIAGTPLYMAPEQAEGKTIDQRADLFSLGSVFYVMLSGRPPFRASGTMAVLKRVCEDTPRPIRDIIPEVPEWLCNIVARLHAKKPEDRFQTAAEVADLLARHLAHMQQPQQAPMSAPVAGPTVEFRASSASPGASEQRTAPSRFGRKALAAAAAGLLLLAAGLPMAYLATRPHEQQEPDHGKPLVKEPPPPGDDNKDVKPTDQYFAALKRENIHPSLLALAGGGDPDQAPPELVAMLGDGRFRLPKAGLNAYMAQDREGKFLAVPNADSVALFDSRTGELVRTLAGTGRMFAVAFSPDGKPRAEPIGRRGYGTWFPGATESSVPTHPIGALFRREEAISPRPMTTAPSRSCVCRNLRKRWCPPRRRSNSTRSRWPSSPARPMRSSARTFPRNCSRRPAAAIRETRRRTWSPCLLRRSPQRPPSGSGIRMKATLPEARRWERAGSARNSTSTSSPRRSRLRS
jgi:serine/threonine protein kinase